MTAPDLDHHGEDAARELAKRLGPVTTLRDPYAAACDFMRWLVANRWRYVPAPLDPIQRHTGRADPPNDDFLTAKAAITRKDTEDHA